MTDRVVLCMKWGTLYGADYVNVLHSAVRRHLKGTFRFVCLTDDATGLADGIEHHPIPNIGYAPRHWQSGAWPKLSVFVDDLYGLRGRALFLDLDIVVAGPLDPLFEAEGDLIAVSGGGDWGRRDRGRRIEANTSAFAFDLGAQAQIVRAFQADPMGAVSGFRIEQRFVERHATSWRPWPEAWIVSFKRHLRRPVGLGLILPPRRPPPEVRIVAFHGEPRPKALVRKGWWGVAPHLGRGPVDWVADYWRENGGPSTST